MEEILVSGSTAFDILMHYDGKITDQLFQERSIGGLNISITSDRYKKNLGGTAANIAYNLSLLGENPILFTSIGHDYSFAGIMEKKVNIQYIHRESTKFSATATIISDREDNKITIFHPGAMENASMSKISYVQEKLSCAIISANHISTMLEHARDLFKKGVKIFADPAQQISQMTQEELKEFIELADYLIVNEYEYADLQRIGVFSEQSLKMQLEVIIVTHGEKGSTLIKKDTSIFFDIINIEDVEDTTGAGDAYRAGILKAFSENWGWEIGCQLGTLLASYSIIVTGAQNHHFSFGIIQEDMKKYFQIDMDLYKKREY